MREGGEQRALYRNIQHPYLCIQHTSTISAHSCVRCLLSVFVSVLGPVTFWHGSGSADPEPLIYGSGSGSFRQRPSRQQQIKSHKEGTKLDAWCLMRKLSGSETLIFVVESDPQILNIRENRVRYLGLQRFSLNLRGSGLLFRTRVSLARYIKQLLWTDPDLYFFCWIHIDPDQSLLCS